MSIFFNWGGIHIIEQHRLAALSILSILLLSAIGAKLIDPHGGLQVGKWAVHDEQAPWNNPYVVYMTN